MREVWVSGSKPSVLGRDSCLYLNTFMICLSPQIVGLEQRIRAAGSSQLALMVICSVAAGEPLRDLATISRSTKHGEGGVFVNSSVRGSWKLLRFITISVFLASVALPPAARLTARSIPLCIQCEANALWTHLSVIYHIMSLANTWSRLSGLISRTRYDEGQSEF